MLKWPARRALQAWFTSESRDNPDLAYLRRRSQLLFAEATHAILVAEPGTGRVRECNDAFLTLIGHSRASVLGRSIDEVGYWPDPVARARLHRVIRKFGHVKNFPATLTHVSGAQRQCSISVEHDGTEQLLVQIVDDTRAAQGETALRHTEAMFRVAFCENPEALLIVRARDGEVVDVNRAFESLTGLGRDAIRARPLPTLTIWAGHPEGDRVIQSALQGTTLIDEPAVARTANGLDLELRITARSVSLFGERHVFCMLKDVTDTQKHQRQASEYASRLESIFEALTEGVLLQAADGSVQLCNDAVPNLLGVSRDALMQGGSEHWQGAWVRVDGTPITHSEHPAYLARMSGRAQNNVVLGRDRPDARRVWLSINSVPLFHPYDEVVYATVSSYTDVTRIVEVEDALRRNNDQLEERVRERTGTLAKALLDVQAAQEELESFSYSVAHDLRAPVNRMRAFAEMLKAEHASVLAEDGARLVDRVLRSARHMDQLISDLLVLARIARTPLNKRMQSTEQLVEEAIAGVTQDAADRVVEWHIEPLPELPLDRALFLQALVNLLGNAVKYTSKVPQARVRIGVDHDRASPTFTTLFIKDNGAGFDMTYADKLFQPFQRLHSEAEFPGSGVGLSIVRRIVQRHGGSVTAQGSPGEGATFRLTLPNNSGDALPPPST